MGMDQEGIILSRRFGQLLLVVGGGKVVVKSGDGKKELAVLTSQDLAGMLNFMTNAEKLQEQFLPRPKAAKQQRKPKAERREKVEKPKEAEAGQVAEEQAAA